MPSSTTRANLSFTPVSPSHLQLALRHLPVRALTHRQDKAGILEASPDLCVNISLLASFLTPHEAKIIARQHVRFILCTSYLFDFL